MNMKLFNPYKAHIAKSGNYYVIRKLGILPSWTYLDKEELDYWWYTTKKYSYFDTLEEATKFLSLYKDQGYVPIII